MNNNINLADIYADFFEPHNSKERKEEISEKIDTNVSEVEIEKLYITDESKNLLEKILEYIRKYNKKEVSNYISFSIYLTNNNYEIVNKIANILNSISKENNYIEGNNITELSLYKLENIDDLKTNYEKSSVIVIKDLNALQLKDDAFKKKFEYELNSNLQSKKITILSGTEDEIKSFSQEYQGISNRYFKFRINATDPTVYEISDDIINLLSKEMITDEFKIKLLDYISNTYSKSNVDYPTYRNNLLNDISFNNVIPELEKNKSMDEIFKELNDLVGLEKVKKILHELEDLITLKNKTKNDLKISNVNLHMVFLGNPGTGKTTVARLVAGILYNLKCISQNKLIEVSSKDLVAEYVGQTAPKTMNVIEKAMGGVLFIDEAYALASNGQNTYNDEAIATLIKAMEDYRDNLVVIFAGYTKEMQAFLDSNSGIVSRIGYMLTFEDYTTDQLVEIFKKMVTKAGFILEEDSIEKLKEIINQHKNDENFGNARFVRNVYEKTIIKHASNTKDKKRKSILKTITKEDITL